MRERRIFEVCIFCCCHLNVVWNSSFFVIAHAVDTIFNHTFMGGFFVLPFRFFLLLSLLLMVIYFHSIRVSNVVLMGSFR